MFFVCFECNLNSQHAVTDVAARAWTAAAGASWKVGGRQLGESLERTRLKFSLQGGKVTALCLQEGEQVWALNIKRALLSMLQTSRTASKQELEKETDVYGTCTSRYERRGPVLLKTRDLKQCQQSRLANFWPHSVALTDDTSVQSELHCVQRHGSTVMEEVNCTEVVSMATWSRTAGLVKTQTVSTLLLLRAQPGTPSEADSLVLGVLTDLKFEEEEGPARPGKAKLSTPQQASQTVRMLCSLTSDPQLVSQQFLQLAFQLRDLTLSQLETLWQEASFKCRNDWQPLLDALPACGSENCIILLTGLMKNKELEEEQAHSFLTTISLIPHPSPQIINSINALVEDPELRSKALLTGSSLVYQLCQRSPTSCSDLPQVQTFIQMLEETLRDGCEGEEPTQVRELVYALKSVGNTGLSASSFIPLLSRCVLGHSAALELRLAAVQAFRRFPCSANRSVLLQLYRSSQEDPEVRIAAYQQLMHCPDQDVFEVVKTTLRSESSSQVGSYVWSHLTNVLRSEDPMKQALIESLPDDIISRDFEAEFLKYSSYSDYTVASGMGITNVETSLVFSPKSFLPRSASANLTAYFHGRAHNLLELFGRRKMEENMPKCWVGVKVFGNELSVFTCEDLYNQINQLSLSAAGLAVKLLKGHEVQLNHRAVLMTEELVLPSLSGLPIKLGINMTSLLSLRLKGNANYRDTSHFSLTGYIKPNAYVGLSARMGVDGALGQAAVDWISELRSSTSLDGSIQLQEGQDLRVTLNTPEDVMDIMSFDSRVFQLSGDHREEIKGPKSRIQKTTCTPKTWSKMVGWQLCSNASYPFAAVGISLPPSGPVHLSLRLLKLDRGLHYYLLEAAYSLLPQRGTWLPREASIHLLLATPQSSIPRDMSLDLAFNPHRLLLRITHPLKTILIQVALERRRDGSSRQYSVEVELLLPGVVGSRMLGLMEQKGSLWSSALRLKYGLGGDARHLRQECHTSQRLRSERDANLTYIMRVDHEFYCSNAAPINHKIHLRHEESPSHVKSSLDMSYGKHWDELNNKRTLLLSQSFKNQSTENHTSYTLEFSLQVPEKNLNYRTQLLHSHLRQLGSESSTHLKINYNNLMPLVAGLHWKSPPKNALQKKWEGMFNMDTPWLYIHTTHKLSQHQRHTLQLTSELTASKWLTIRNLILEAFYRDRGREREARLELYTPAATYLQAGGWGTVGKRNMKASCSLSSLWTAPLRGDVSLEASKFSHTLQMASSYGKHNVSLTAALNIVDKNLKKRQVIVKMSMSEPKSQPTELEFEGTVEELRKDKKMYQKTAMLQLRETFTVDLLKGLYILESRAGFHGNKEVIHTLTLGYQPPSPFVCSALIHFFSSDTIPSDSEICVTISSNQTQKDIYGKLRVGSKERLTFFGQVQLNPLHSSHQAIKVKANLTHQLQLQLPSSAIVEGDVCWKPRNSMDFDYVARGKLRIERQECQAKATADISTGSGIGSTSVRVRADGKDRVMLDAQMSHSLQHGDRAMGLRLNLSQSFLPAVTDMYVNMAANMSSDSMSLHGSYTQGHEALLAQVKGSLKDIRGLQLAVSGDLRHSVTNLAFLPSALGLDGALGQSDTLIEGQLRVRVMETLYSVELRHQEDPGESLGREDDDSMMGKKSHVARDWLCVWLGAENLCVNVSRQMGVEGRGEVYTQLSHSFNLLNDTGVPVSSSAQLRWFQDGGRLSVLAELQAGPEHLKAEFNRGRTDTLIPRWEFLSRLQHQVKALLKRGISSSVQAKAHYQLDTEGLDAGLVLHMEDERIADILFAVGSKNSTAILVVSLWQRMKLLQGLIPASLLMNCTGDATADRLTAQCYGNVAGRPVEVRAFRSYRPHNRLCYGLSLTHFSLSAQLKGCFSPNGQKELRANLTHSSALLLTFLGVPTKSGLRLLLRPGPQRWALGIGLVVGPWRMDLNVALRVERAGLYGWHGLLEYGSRSITNKAEMTGRMRLESWCHIWADVSVAWDSVSSTLLVSVRCNGVGRLVWEQVRRVEGGLPHKTSLTVHGKAGKDGLRGSLGLENQQDSLHCLLSVLLKNHKAEVGWTLQHHWASVASIIPNRVDLQGSGQLHDTSLSGSAQVSFNTHSAQLDVTATWEPFTSFRVTLQQNLATTGVPGAVTVSMLSTASQAQVEVESDVCSVLLLANQQRRGAGKMMSWNVFVHQRCVFLKSLQPPQSSVNVSIIHSGCSTNLSAVLQAEDEQKVNLTLSLACHPSLSLKASVRHSIEAIQTVGFPTNGALILNVSAAHVPEVEVGLELGRCYFRGKTTSSETETERNRSSYAVNVTNYCPALQGTVLPVSLVLRGLLSVDPCLLTVTSFLRADNQNLTLELGQSCRSPHLSGTLTHTFPGLRSRGLPQTITVEATGPGGSEEAGALLIKAGTCHIRANRVIEAKGRTKWLWALESKCPMLQAHLNGSVQQEAQGIWAAMVDTSLGGKRGFLRLNARAWPELSLDGELNHNLPALRSLPERSRLRVTSRAGKQRYDTEALIQMGECAVRAIGAVMSHPGLQGSLVYFNNCTVIQEWGSPDRIQASGSLVVSPTIAESHVSMAIDNTELQALVALKKTKLSQEMTVEKTSETVRVKSNFRHTLNYLKKLGVPGNNSIQVELGSAEGKNLTLQSQFGDQQAGLILKMKCFPMTKEITGTMWHSWSWLQDRGVPLNIEGAFSQLQSRVQLTVDGHKLLVSGLNVSVAGGRLAGLLSYSPLTSNQTETQFSLDTALTAQFKGPLRSASIDIHCEDWRVRVMGDIGGWGTHAGSKEARVTLKHTVQGQTSPALQVEAWGRLAGSQLRCSMAVNPELSSSLALIIQGHHLPHSKDLMVKVVQNIPKMMVYLPSQLNVRSQLNQSQSSVAGLVEVSSGRRRLWALGEVAAIESGYRQALELKHSYPQLKPLPRTVAVRTVYEARNWSYQVQHGAVWGNQEFSLSGLYFAPPALEMGNQTLKVQITCIPRWTSLEVTLEHSLLGRLDSVSLGWTRHGQLEQVRALSLWSRSEEMNETKLELKQPFSSTLSHLSLHTVSYSSQREKRSSHQTHLSWESAVPVNVSLSLNKQWQINSSRGQACALFSTQQKGPRGMHSLQVNVGLDKVSPAPCPSHTLLAKVQTNLRDRFEHTVLLGLCPPQPTLSWSGSHRLNSGDELFYTQSRLSVTGRPHQCSLTLALTNSSTTQGTNMSLFSESRMGNWSVEVGGSALSWPRGSGLQVQARLDRREKIWLNGTVEGRCLQTTAGYKNGSGLNEDVTVLACVGTNHGLKLDVQKRDGSNKPETLGSVSVGTANHRLMLRASGCLESLTAVEARVHYLSSQIRRKLLERIKTIQNLLTEFRRQSRDSALLQELSAVPLHVSQRAEALLGQRDRGLSALWQNSPLRRIWTDSLPRFLGLLQHTSLLGQQELRRPLATLAGVYQDVRGQRLDALWREAVSLWTDRLVEVLPTLLENPQLRPLAQTSVATLSVALDVVRNLHSAGQHTYHWVESRLAVALSGVRKRLASVYKYSPSECSVTVSVPLPTLPRSRLAEAGLVEILLEDWLLRPLQTLASIRPTAELYRLKRKIMDSPFMHQALLVADQFVVTFDGNLYELPASCPLLLAQDISADPSFTLLLSSDSQNFLLLGMNNSTINIQHNGQVKANCNTAVMHTFHSDSGVAVRRGSNVVQVSNQNGVSLSCDLTLELCSFTLDGWLHGTSTGLLGSNDNEAGNDFPLPDGSQAENLEDFSYSWQMKPECIKPPATAERLSKVAVSPVTCDFLFSSPDSPLSSCFRVVSVKAELTCMTSFLPSMNLDYKIN
eukprot:superscaffoldBa00002579_g14706